MRIGAPDRSAVGGARAGRWALADVAARRRPTPTA